MPTPRIGKYDPESIYFCTFTVIEWIDIFTSDVYFQILLDSLRYCQRHKGLLLHGYVIMTNHIHLIFSTEHPHNPDVFVRDFKKWTTKAISEELERDSRRYIKNLLLKTIFKKKNTRIQIWQHSNYPVKIESEEFFIQKLNYIHANPVRKGFVDDPKDWLYSSARNWEGGDHSVIEVRTTELC